MIKLISWNVRKVGEKIASRQAVALCNQEPDIIALQDVNIHSTSLYEEEFSRIGLVHTAHTFQEVLAQLGKGRYPRITPQRFAERYQTIRRLL